MEYVARVCEIGVVEEGSREARERRSASELREREPEAERRRSWLGNDLGAEIATTGDSVWRTFDAKFHQQKLQS